MEGKEDSLGKERWSSRKWKDDPLGMERVFSWKGMMILMEWKDYPPENGQKIISEKKNDPL